MDGAMSCSVGGEWALEPDLGLPLASSVTSDKLLTLKAFISFSVKWVNNRLSLQNFCED